MVWAAGIAGGEKSPETNRLNHIQLVVQRNGQRIDRIYAIGDCASCARPEGGFVPPRGGSPDGDLRAE
jgi:NADH dehydrogenase